MPSLQTYPTNTRVRIGDRIFHKEATSSFWREVSPVPGNCVSRPAASLLALEQQSNAPHVVIGYFVDWDGNTRRVEAPGAGYSCQLTEHADYVGVDVVEPDGCVCHEAVYYPTIESLQAVGVSVNLVG